MSGEDDSLLYSCVLCSDITQEKARKEEAANGRKDKQFRVRPSSMARMLRCLGCRSNVCLTCAKAFPVAMRADGLTPEIVPWIGFCDDFVASTAPVCFVPAEQSHCCRYRHLLHGFVGGKRDSSGEPLASPSSVMLPCVPLASSVQGKNGKKIHLDGMLHFPAYGTLLAPSFSHPDVISVAAQLEPPVDGALHSVTRPLAAMGFYARGVMPKLDASNAIADLWVDVSVTHPLDGTTVDLPTRITIVPYVGTDREEGSNLEDDEEVKCNCALMMDGACKKEIKKGTKLWLCLGGEWLRPGT